MSTAFVNVSFENRHLELLEMCRKKVKLVIILPWNLPPPWKLVPFLLKFQFFPWLPRLTVECYTFNGTKSNYLVDQANKWFVLEDLKSCLEIEEEHQTSCHFPTLTIVWRRDPSRRKSFFVFFHRISSIANEFFFSPSIHLLKIRPFSWLDSSYLVRDVLHRLRSEGFSLGYISQTECLHKIQAQKGGPI